MRGVVSLFLLFFGWSELTLATMHQPVVVSPTLIGDRNDLQRMLNKFSLDINDPRWQFDEFGDQQTRVKIDKKVAAFIDDLTHAIQQKSKPYIPGSEQLFNRLDPLNPPFKKLKELSFTIELVTGALLLMPSGPAFFQTPSGQALRVVFRKLRSTTEGPVQISALNLNERELLIIYLGGILWRMRGGGLIDLPKGTQDTRKYFVEYAFTSFGEIAGKDTSSIASSFRWALQMKGWGKYMDMGHTTGQEDETYDLIYMTDRGRYQVDGSEGPIKKQKGYYDSLKVGGYMMGACYFMAWRYFADIREGAGLPIPLADYLGGPTTIGEVCSGASLSLGIYRALNP